MKWEEVRQIYPDKFVKVEVLDSHIKGDKKLIDEVAVIDTVSDDNATKELLKSKEDILVYHTSKESFALEIRNESWL